MMESPLTVASAGFVSREKRSQEVGLWSKFQEVMSKRPTTSMLHTPAYHDMRRLLEQKNGNTEGHGITEAARGLHGGGTIKGLGSCKKTWGGGAVGRLLGDAEAGA